MFTLGVLEFVLGGFFFYFLGKRCQNHNKEYIELDENQYDSIKDYNTSPNGSIDMMKVKLYK